MLAALGNNVVTCNTRTMQVVCRSHPLANPSDACFSHSGAKLAIKNTSGRIVIIDPESGEVQVDYNNDQEGEGAGILFSPDDQYIVDGSWEGSIYIRNAAGGAPKTIHSKDNEMIVGVSSSRDACTWAFLHAPKIEEDEDFSCPEYVTVWNWPFSTHRTIQMNFSFSRNVTISPDGSRFAAHGYMRSEKQYYINIFSINGELISSKITNDAACHSLRWSPDGSLIGAALGDHVFILSVSSLETIRTYEIKGAYDVCFSPNLSFIALGAIGSGSIEPFSIDTEQINQAARPA